MHNLSFSQWACDNPLALNEVIGTGHTSADGTVKILFPIDYLGNVRRDICKHSTRHLIGSIRRLCGLLWRCFALLLARLLTFTQSKEGKCSPRFCSGGECLGRRHWNRWCFLLDLRNSCAASWFSLRNFLVFTLIFLQDFILARVKKVFGAR